MGGLREPRKPLLVSNPKIGTARRTTDSNCVNQDLRSSIPDERQTLRSAFSLNVETTVTERRDLPLHFF